MDAQERARRKASGQRIIERLQQGPATNMELSEICLRFSARIFEAREAGHTIKLRRIGAGLMEYTLLDKDAVPA